MKQNEVTNSVCPRCSTIFECGISAGKNLCWCFAHPAVVLSEYGERCLCEKCLEELIAKQSMQKKNV